MGGIAPPSPHVRNTTRVKTAARARTLYLPGIILYVPSFEQQLCVRGGWRGEEPRARGGKSLTGRVWFAAQQGARARLVRPVVAGAVVAVVGRTVGGLGSTPQLSSYTGTSPALYLFNVTLMRRRIIHQAGVCTYSPVIDLFMRIS